MRQDHVDMTIVKKSVIVYNLRATIIKIMTWPVYARDFSMGGSVCGYFANHTHFKTTPIIRKLRATAFNN